MNGVNVIFNGVLPRGIAGIFLALSSRAKQAWNHGIGTKNLNEKISNLRDEVRVVMLIWSGVSSLVSQQPFFPGFFLAYRV